MSTITKQWLQQTIAEMEEHRDLFPGDLDDNHENVLAAMRIALASLEAEPVAYVDPFAFHNFSVYRAGKTDNKRMGREWMWANPDAGLIPVYTSPPEPVTINAEPVAWLWSHRKHPSEVSLVRPEDDERAEGAHWSGWSCQALYAAHPAPVSLQAGGKLSNFVASQESLGGDFEKVLAENIEELYVPGSSVQPAPVSVPDALADDIHSDDHPLLWSYNNGWNACRAAMLQGADGNSPVIPDGWVACSERMPEQFKAILAFNEYGEVWSGAYDRYWNFYCDNLLVEHVTHWMPLPAAPQQEVK